MTQPLATCVIGTWLWTLTSGVRVHAREGTMQTPSERCADANGSRRTTRAAAGSSTVTSADGVVLIESSPAMRLATKARDPSGVMATANGSRPADNRHTSSNERSDTTEMSSDIEFATTNR